jgi:hypothetical protein
MYASKEKPMVGDRVYRLHGGSGQGEVLKVVQGDKVLVQWLTPRENVPGGPRTLPAPAQGPASALMLIRRKE